VDFEAYHDTLAPIGVTAKVDPVMAAELQAVAREIQGLRFVDRKSLTALVERLPDAVPALGLTVGLGLEQLRGFLRHRFGTESWGKAVKQDAAALVAAMDAEYGLVEHVTAQRNRNWTFADVLVARASSRSRATAGMGRGRRVEDQVEAVVTSLGLPCDMRTRFVGRDGRDAPCDLAIPKAGPDALIVCAAKGNDSTGSKLTDAVGEIRQMAEVRLPKQYVFAVVDGIGWIRRQSDLRRIYDLRQREHIDGLYTLAMLADFRADLETAARRVGLL